jgi:plastocyanin
MTFVAFSIVRASALNRIQPVEYSAIQNGNGGSQQTVTTTETDSLGCSVTFTTATAAICTAWLTCDLEVQVTGSTVFQGRLNIDTVTVTTKEVHLNGASLLRMTPGQTIDFTLSGAGTHTVKLRLLKTAAAATIVTDDQHTGFTLSVREIV